MGDVCFYETLAPGAIRMLAFSLPHQRLHRLLPPFSFFFPLCTLLLYGLQIPRLHSFVDVFSWSHWSTSVERPALGDDRRFFCLPGPVRENLELVWYFAVELIEERDRAGQPTTMPVLLRNRS